MAEAAKETMMPTSCTVRESCVVPGAVEDVWNVVGKVDFSWRPDVTSCKIDGAEMQLCNREITYKDGDVKQTKALRGVNSYDYTATWEMVTSDPPVSYSSARYSVHLEPITMTEQTLVIFTTVYSNDASIEVTEDQRCKLREGIAAINNLCKTQAQ